MVYKALTLLDKLMWKILQEIRDEYAASDLDDDEEFDILIEFRRKLKQNAPHFVDELLLDAVKQFN